LEIGLAPDSISILTGNDLETCVCPICESGDSAPTPYRDGPYAVRRCLACGLWYLSPRLTPAAMGRRYAQESYFGGGDSGYEDYADQEPSLRRTFHALLRNLSAQGWCGGSLLEVGCGFGFLLDEARPYFARRCGTEMSAAAAQRARPRAEQIFAGGLDDVPAGQSFDCIVALHVFEHIYEPRQFLASVRAKLNPKGRFVVAVPDMGSLWRRAMGRSWPSFKYPEHVTFFDAPRLRRALLDAGFVAPRRIRYANHFRLADIGRKLGLPIPRPLGDLALPLPATTVCFAAARAMEGRP
jgi:SAM-dependent methyltransferase